MRVAVAARLSTVVAQMVRPLQRVLASKDAQTPALGLITAVVRTVKPLLKVRTKKDARAFILNTVAALMASLQPKVLRTKGAMTAGTGSTSTENCRIKK